jgi:hypothetical protein
MEDNYLLVFSSPLGGREDEFNTWYDEIHIPEILACSGITAARRYVAGPGALGRPDPPHRYLALYDLGRDPRARLESLVIMRAANAFTPSGANDPSAIYVWQYRALNERPLA